MQTKTKNEYFIIGYGKFGSEIGKVLNANGLNVVALEQNQQLVEKAAETCSYAIKVDATDIDQLQQTGIAKAKTVIVAISDVQSSILTCANLIQLAVKGKIIARAMNMTHKRVLKTMGIEHVTVPETEVAYRVALQAMYHFNQNVYSITEGFSWIQLIVSNNNVVDREIKDLDLRAKLGGTILFINHNGKSIFPVSPDAMLELGDSIAVMCPDYNLGKVVDYFTDPMFQGTHKENDTLPIFNIIKNAKKGSRKAKKTTSKKK